MQVYVLLYFPHTFPFQQIHFLRSVRRFILFLHVRRWSLWVLMKTAQQNFAKLLTLTTFELISVKFELIRVNFSVLWFIEEKRYHPITLSLLSEHRVWPL